MEYRLMSSAFLERAFTLVCQCDFQNSPTSSRVYGTISGLSEKKHLFHSLFPAPKQNKLFPLAPGSVSQKSTSPVWQPAA